MDVKLCKIHNFYWLCYLKFTVIQDFINLNKNSSQTKEKKILHAFNLILYSYL